MITVKGLTKTYGSRRVLDQIDLEVPAGQIVAIMGSSGGGKTTLLRCISGLHDLTAGSITVDGIDVQTQPDEARRKMGMVFQSAALFDYMSVYDNVAFGVRRHLRLSRPEEKRKVEETLNRVGLTEATVLMPSEISGGMRKRVGLARALALEPSVMLYDEPTTGLDPITTYAIDELIVRLKRELGMTSLLVSHDVSSVFRTADRICFLHEGHLAFEGSVEDFERCTFEPIRELVEKSQAKTIAQTEQS